MRSRSDGINHTPLTPLTALLVAGMLPIEMLSLDPSVVQHAA